jgi:hypothetical protein
VQAIQEAATRSGLLWYEHKFMRLCDQVDISRVFIRTVSSSLMARHSRPTLHARHKNGVQYTLPTTAGSSNSAAGRTNQQNLHAIIMWPSLSGVRTACISLWDVSIPPLQGTRNCPVSGPATAAASRKRICSVRMRASGPLASHGGVSATWV